MKYDDASWHYGGDFPAGLPNEAGGTHAGMFVAWALLSGLGGDIHTIECPEDLESLESHSLTPGQFFLRICDGKFTEEDLSAEDNAFAEHYYVIGKGAFLGDYVDAFPEELPSLYHVPDAWETFEILKPIFDRRLKEWRGGA